jgi:hypothetical protein
MKSIRTAIFAVALLPIVLSGCAAHRAQARAKLPIAETVCLKIDGVKETEKGLRLGVAVGSEWSGRN